MLRQFCFLTLILTSMTQLSAQEYVPFPTDTAIWNQVYLGNYFPGDNYISNHTYLQQGDTVINETNYKKIYFRSQYPIDQEFEFIGGLREDDSKNIYFYASSVDGNYWVNFPEYEAEYLLYSFNDLEVGTTIPTESLGQQPYVVGIDSILIQGNYRKTYEMDGALYDIWIEGIGSSKDLLSSHANEFEWTLNAVCYTDNIVGTYIFEPYDTCFVGQPDFVLESNAVNFKLFPNPVTNEFSLESDHFFQNGRISIFNSFGQVVLHDTFNGYVHQLNGEGLTQGMYFLFIRDGDQELRVRFLKQ